MVPLCRTHENRQSRAPSPVRLLPWLVFIGPLPRRSPAFPRWCSCYGSRMYVQFMCVRACCIRLLCILGDRDVWFYEREGRAKRSANKTSAGYTKGSITGHFVINRRTIRNNDKALCKERGQGSNHKHFAFIPVPAAPTKMTSSSSSSASLVGVPTRRGYEKNNNTDTEAKKAGFTKKKSSIPAAPAAPTKMTSSSSSPSASLVGVPILRGDDIPTFVFLPAGLLANSSVDASTRESTAQTADTTCALAPTKAGDSEWPRRRADVPVGPPSCSNSAWLCGQAVVSEGSGKGAEERVAESAFCSLWPECRGSCSVCGSECQLTAPTPY